MMQPVLVPLTEQNDVFAVVSRREYWRIAPDCVEPEMWAAVVAKLRRRASLDQQAMLDDDPDGWRAALVAHKQMLDAVMTRMRAERATSVSDTAAPETERARLSLLAAWATEKTHAAEWASRVQGHITLVNGIINKRAAEAPERNATDTDRLWSRIRALEARVESLSVAVKGERDS